MNGFESSPALWFFVLAQLFGVLSAWLARLSEGSACQTLSQGLFFLALPFMGIMTAAALAVGPGWWLCCSATLAVMILTVTCDFRKSHELAIY